MNHLLNSNFRLKITGLGYHQLCGYPLLVNLVGEDLAIRLIYRAISARTYKYTVRLRRGLKLDFYSK